MPEASPALRPLPVMPDPDPASACPSTYFAGSTADFLTCAASEDRVSREGMASGWDNSAEAWIAAMSDDGDWARTAVLDPVMLARATHNSPVHALDVGCGEGRFCRLLAGAGIQATGVDPTRTLIEAARQRHETGRYYVGEAESLPFPDRCFDLVVSYLSLVDIERLAPSISEMTRVLAPGGHLLVANLASHNSAGQWLKDGSGKRLGFLIDHYLEERPVRQQWAGIDIINWHRPLATYMQEFLAYGLRLTFFDEPKPLAGEDPISHKFVRAPWFVVMEWRKDEAGSAGT